MKYEIYGDEKAAELAKALVNQSEVTLIVGMQAMISHVNATYTEGMLSKDVEIAFLKGKVAALEGMNND